MAISLEGLDPVFRTMLEKTLAACAKRGVVMVPYFGRRTPMDQGKLWRQSRSSKEIVAEVARLEANGAPYLAHCITAAGPQQGEWATNAVPGLSWHQWMEAMDCYWQVNGTVSWSTQAGGPNNGYRIYAEEATKAGLDAGGLWKIHKDWPHVQKRAASSPVSAGMTLAQIDKKMREMFPHPAFPAKSTAAPAVAATDAAKVVDPDAQHLGSIAALIGQGTALPGHWTIQPRKLVKLPGGQLYIDSEYQLDTDGWSGPAGGMDPTHQGETSLRYANGASMNSNSLPFFVLPLPAAWPGQFGISLGDYAAILYKGRLAYAVFADFGPTDKIGEGSLQLFRQLGQERIKPDGTVWDTGMGPGIKTIVFPKSGKGQRFFGDQASLLAHMQATARDLFIKLGGQISG